MVEHLLREFRKLYLGLLEKRGGDAERERLLSIMKLLEEQYAVTHLMRCMDDVFARTQKLQFHLVENLQRINDHVYYTHYKNIFYFIDVTAQDEDGSQGMVRVINLDRARVIIVGKNIFIQDEKAPDLWTRQLYNSKTDVFDFQGIPNRFISTGYSSKGHGNYRSIKRAHGDEKAINHRIHTIIFGALYGYSSLLASGSTEIYEINHINEVIKCNGETNLELKTHKENIQHSAKLKKKRIDAFRAKHFGVDSRTA